MGLPQIIIAFQTAGSTAVQRSARGSAALLLSGTGENRIFTALPEDSQLSALGSQAARLLKLCFMGGPARVFLRYTGTDAEEALAEAFQSAAGGWVCAPEVSAETVTAYVRKERDKGRPLRAVVSSAAAPDCAGIVNFTASGITALIDGQPTAISAAEYAARIAGLLAGLPLSQSATYYPLPEITQFTPAQDPAAEISAGHLILDRGAEGARLARAVTSLISTEKLGEAFQKIKITEGVDLIRSDIRTAFERNYIGKVLNDYDAKLLLVTAINGYFSGLEGSVLDSGGKNEAEVDFSAQRAYLESRGVRTEAMSRTAILSANTGSQVFLRASVHFADAMEDLSFTITM